MKKGDTVSWRTINGTTSGRLMSEIDNGYWLVSLRNGKVVMVHENSFIRG